jgi:AbrB family looped-hinge helix DNA binding protein
MRTTVSSKGQIVLPSELRDQDQIVPGQQFSIERIKPGQYLLRKLDFPERTGTAQWLASCPAKDWFEPIDSDSTDSL